LTLNIFFENQQQFNKFSIISFQLFEYNLDDWEFKFSTQLSLKKKFSNDAMLNLCLDPRNKNVIIFQRDNKIFVLNKNPSQGDNEEQIARKKKKSKDRKNLPGENFKLNAVKVFKSVNKFNFN
jgi:hypothetical protein